MNPLNWKREHQIAFLCAAALGCLLGLVAGFQWVRPNGHFEINYLPLGYWLLLMFWATLGGLIGAAVIYIRQLLRT